MTPAQALTLGQGDIVRHSPSGSGYTVLQNSGRAVHVVRHFSVSNQAEWDSAVPLKDLPIGSVVRHFAGFEVVLIAPGFGVSTKLVSDSPEDWVLVARPRFVEEGSDALSSP